MPLTTDDAEFGMREHWTPNQMLERIRELEMRAPRERLSDAEIDRLINDYMPKDGLDRLRHVFRTLTEEEWCELGRQLYPVGIPWPRSRADIIAWLKTWMHRS